MNDHGNTGLGVSINATEVPLLKWKKKIQSQEAEKNEHKTFGHCSWDISSLVILAVSHWFTVQYARYPCSIQMYTARKIVYFSGAPIGVSIVTWPKARKALHTTSAYAPFPQASDTFNCIHVLRP